MGLPTWKILAAVTATVAISSALFATGFSAGASKKERDQLAEKLRLEKMISEKEEERRTAVANLEKASSDFNNQLVVSLVQLRESLLEQEKARVKAVHEYYRSHPDQNLRIGAGAVRVWREGNGEGRKPSGSEASTPASTPGVDGKAEGCTLADLQSNHDELIVEYRAVSNRLESLQAWARETFRICTSQVP